MLKVGAVSGLGTPRVDVESQAQCQHTLAIFVGRQSDGEAYLAVHVGDDRAWIAITMSTVRHLLGL